MKTEKRRTVSDLAFAASLVVVFAAVVTAGLSGAVSGSQNETVTVTATSAAASTAGPAQNSSAPYDLTLVITPNNVWNSSTTAPQYWVVTPNGMVSSANISLPAHRLIQLTVEDLDTGNDPLPAQYSQVTGTVGNSEMVMNLTAATQDPTNASNYNVVTSLDSQSQVSHTFTIPQLGINIPSPAQSVEVVDFTINQTGTFAWQCMDPCGFGPSGWLGPMSQAGWMQGSVTVS